MEKNLPLSLGPKGLIKSHEFVRIIIQSLDSLGYRESATCLEAESGIALNYEDFEALESHILTGNWDECVDCIHKMEYLTDETRALALFHVLKQCVLECLNRRDDSLALEILRKQIVGLRVSKDKVHKLALGVLSLKGLELASIDLDVIEELRRRLLEELEGVLPPPITMPPRRLEHLIEMAVCGQIDNCMYHSSSEPISLYEDHHCDRDQFPTETIQILADHKNEVWFVQFSNNGKYLASSSSDCTSIIWKVYVGKLLWEVGVNLIVARVTPTAMAGEEDMFSSPCYINMEHYLMKLKVMDNNKVAHRHTIRSHQKPVSFVAWSPDDTMLLTCGNMEVLKLWDVGTGTCKQTYGNDGFIVSSCAWFPDSKRLVCGSLEPGKGIYMWDCEGNEIRSWKGARMPKISDLAVTPDGENLISVFKDKEIWILNLRKNSERVISEVHPITSLSLSGDGKFLIVNLNSQEIHLWDVAGDLVKPTKYKGHRQHKYVIRSCFGGVDCRFIASGSEDSKVYIWNRRGSYPLEVLSGHLSTVNSVSWNSQRPQMLASASDDQTIRIWGPNYCN